MAFVCDGCNEEHQGARVVFTTEATDESGVDVVVAKRWTACQQCADEVFDRIGEPSPWSDADFKTMVLPGEEPVGNQAGGYSGSVER